MFCSRCGKEIDNEAVICPICGCETHKKVIEASKNNEPKTGMGVLLAILLGLIGLVIGLVLYPSNTESRKTFIKGWVIAYAVTMAVEIIILIICLGSFSTFNPYY